jgi:glycosyltransferase involved in cell wall biosynthesis
MDQLFRYAVLIPIHEPHSHLNSAISSVFDDVEQKAKIYLILHKPDVRLEMFIKSSPFYDDITVLRSYSDSLGGCLNDALKEIEEEFVFRMDSDDVWLKGRFSIQTEYLEKNPKTAVIAGGINVVNTIYNLQYPLTVEKKMRLRPKHFLLNCPVKHPTVLYNRKVILSEGGYNTGVRCTEDYELWTRIVRRQKVVLLPEIVLEYRFHEKSQSYKFQKIQLEEAKWINGKLACGLLRLNPCKNSHQSNTPLACSTRVNIVMFIKRCFFKSLSDLSV